MFKSERKKGIWDEWSACEKKRKLKKLCLIDWKIMISWEK